MNSDPARTRMREAGYLPPMRRPGCQTCAHGRIVFEGGSKRVRCEVLRADTACAGWCPRHTVAMKVAA